MIASEPGAHRSVNAPQANDGTSNAAGKVVANRAAGVNVLRERDWIRVGVRFDTRQATRTTPVNTRSKIHRPVGYLKVGPGNLVKDKVLRVYLRNKGGRGRRGRVNSTKGMHVSPPPRPSPPTRPHLVRPNVAHANRHPLRDLNKLPLRVHHLLAARHLSAQTVERDRGDAERGG